MRQYRSISRFMTVSFLLGLTACAADSTKSAENPAPADGVQERAVIRDRRAEAGTFTPSQKAPPPVGKPGSQVFVPVPMPQASTPSTGTGGPSSVVGGILEPDYQFPWVVRLNGCGGVLIDPQWVLTAAHCVTQGIGLRSITYSRTDPYSGAVQTETRAPMSEQRPNPGVRIHPDYNPANDQANDIALIKLDRPFTINPSIQTVGLPRDFRHAGLVGALASIDHVRMLPPGKASLFRAPIPQETFPPKFNITVGAASASLCPGDSGSGFVTVENGRATVRGVASQGSISTSDCKIPSGEATFTDVFAFRGWILQTMGMNDAFNSRVRWSGRAARGTMGLGCVNPYNMTLWGPLNVVGVEEGMPCEAGQTQTVICNLEKNQGNVGVMVPTLSGLTVRTTTSNGASNVQTIPASGTSVSFFGLLPAGTFREFTCQIATPVTGATTGMNAQVLSRGIEGESGGEPTIIQPSPFDPSEETKP